MAAPAKDVLYGGPPPNGVEYDEENDRGKVVQEFAEDTTMHGLKFLFAPGIVRKIIWLILIIASIAFSIYQIKEQFENYVSSPISTAIGVEFPDELPFPAIMICNSNQYRIQKAYETQMYKTIDSAYAPIKYAVNDTTILKNVANKYGNSLTKLITEFGNEIPEMMLECTGVDGTRCENKFTLRMTEYGPCYVFNGKHNKNVTQAGPSQALTLYVNLAVYQTMAGPAELSSLKVSVYSNNSEPVVSMNAIDVPAGFMSVIGLSHHREDKISSCVDSQEMVHYSADSYDAYKCKQDAIFNAIEFTCNCTPFYAPMIKNSSACTIEQYFKCVIPLDTTKVKAECEDSCSTSGYSTTLSLAKLQSSKMKKLSSKFSQKSFDDAMEAFSRNDNETVIHLEKLISNAFKTIIDAPEGLRPASVLTTQSMLLMYSDQNKNWSRTFKSVFTGAQSKEQGGQPGGDDSQNSEDTTITSSNLMLGLNKSLNAAQLANFTKPAFNETNVNTSIDIFAAWSNWSDIFNKPMWQNNGGGGPPGSGNNGISYFVNMGNSTVNFKTGKITRRQWTYEMKPYDSFPRDYAEKVCGKLNSADEFLTALTVLETHPIYLQAIDYLDNDTEIADAFWLSMNFASTAYLLINFEGECSSYTKPSPGFTCHFSDSNSQQNVGGGGPPGRRKRQIPSGGGGSIPNSPSGSNNPLPNGPSGSVISGFQQFPAPTTTQNFYVTGQLAAETLGIQSALSNIQLFQNSYNLVSNASEIDGGSGLTDDGADSIGLISGSPPSGCFKTCKIPSNATYYKNFFRYLRDELSVLKKETDQFIQSHRASCNAVGMAYRDLYDDLQEYALNWFWDDTFYERNILGLKIYFSSLSTQTLVQSEAYSLFSLICDIGGSLGLFLGASLLTFFEVIDMIVYGLLCTKKNQNKVGV